MEDPELYRTRTHSRTEEGLRRKMVRQMIAELPGKLDHASVVAYKVGRWYGTINPNICNEESKPQNNDDTFLTIKQNKEKLPIIEENEEIKSSKEVFLNCNLKRNCQNADATKVIFFNF